MISRTLCTVTSKEIITKSPLNEMINKWNVLLISKAVDLFPKHHNVDIVKILLPVQGSGDMTLLQLCLSQQSRLRTHAYSFSVSKNPGLLYLRLWFYLSILKPTGYLMHHSTIVLSAHTVFMCFVFIWEQTATCATYSINWLVFITEMKSVYSAVRTDALYKADYSYKTTWCIKYPKFIVQNKFILQNKFWLFAVSGHKTLNFMTK